MTKEKLQGIRERFFDEFEKDVDLYTLGLLCNFFKKELRKQPCPVVWVTDEQIEEAFPTKHPKHIEFAYYSPNNEFIQKGAKWMRNKIKGKNK